MNTTRHAGTTYVDAVRDALSDLPADEVAEIVEDLTEHLDQVATELGPHDLSTGELEARLGSPEAYAAELRAAAGYPAMSGTPGLMRMRLRRMLRFIVTWILRAAAVAGAIGVASAVLADWYWGSALIGYAALTAVVALGLWLLAHGRHQVPTQTLRALPDATLAERWYTTAVRTPWGQTFKEFAVSLRPAWWVLRAWIAVQLVAALSPDNRSAFPLPRLPGAAFILVAAILVSVWLGRRAMTGELRGWLQLGQVGGNAVAILTAPILISAMANPAVVYVDSGAVEYYETSYNGIAHDDGSPITNLFLYDSNGQLLEGVRIYDQDGRPVDNLEWWDECGREGGMHPGGAHGNVFPRPTTDWDEDGECYVAEIRSPFGSALLGAAVAEIAADNVADEDAPETDESVE